MASIFDIQGFKIPLFNIQGAYDDLLGLPIDRNKFIPWVDVATKLKTAGVNDVMLIVSAGVLEKYNDSKFSEVVSYNPPREAIVKLVGLLQKNGINVSISLFPHVANIVSGDSSLSGQDRPQPQDKILYQAMFSKSTLEWAAFAQEIKASAFIPFTDVDQHLLFDKDLTAGWAKLLDEVKTIYSGPISTTWWTQGPFASQVNSPPELMPSEILNRLDYLGIGLFPDLTVDGKGSIDQLVEAYFSDARGNNLIDYLQRLSEKLNKRIWITDKAFHSFEGAGSQEGRIFNQSIPLIADQEVQSRLYESFLRVFSAYGADWFAGVSFQSINNVLDSTDLLPRYTNGSLSEEPFGKLAERVIGDWFTGKVLPSGFRKDDQYGLFSQIDGGSYNDTLIGGNGNDTISGGKGDDIIYADENPIENFGYIVG